MHETKIMKVIEIKIKIYIFIYFNNLKKIKNITFFNLNQPYYSPQNNITFYQILNLHLLPHLEQSRQGQFVIGGRCTACIGNGGQLITKSIGQRRSTGRKVGDAAALVLESRRLERKGKIKH